MVVGEIEAIEQDLGVTPAGHHNRLCRVALPDKRFSVVCGAPNAAPGLRTAFAPPGATLPGGRTIKVTKIRGTLSEGMLCSEEELGIGMDGSGILELPADAPPGATPTPPPEEAPAVATEDMGSASDEQLVQAIDVLRGLSVFNRRAAG